MSGLSHLLAILGVASQYAILAAIKMMFECDYTGLPKKTSRTLRNYNGAYTLWGDISFSTFVDQYVLLLTYKFQ